MEDVLTFALFPKIALEFFELREKGEIGKPEPFPPALAVGDRSAVSAPLMAPSEFNIKVHGETYHIKVGGMGHPGEGGRPYFIYVDDQLEEVLVESLVEVVQGAEGRIGVEMTGRSTRPKATQEGDITTAMPGTVVKVKVRVGDRVKAGETVLIIEAMKLENEVHTPIAGEVKTIYVSEGDRVNPDEALVEVRSSEGTI